LGHRVARSRARHLADLPASRQGVAHSEGPRRSAPAPAWDRVWASGTGVLGVMNGVTYEKRVVRRP
jgi:hypothetical protein